MENQENLTESIYSSFSSIDFKKLGEDNIISALKLLKENGNFFNIDQTVGPKKYLLYPPNISSPPSPDSATFMCLLVSLAII